MQNKTLTSVKWLCAILYIVFAFCWYYFLQRDLVCAAYNKLLYGLDDYQSFIVYDPLIVSGVLTVAGLLFVLLGKLLLRFKYGLYAYNYLFSAAFLGLTTAYDGSSFLGHSYRTWMVSVVAAVVLYIICKIISTMPRSEYNVRSRTWAGNLLLMFLLFTLVGYMGNTDENLHRSLYMERLYAESDYPAILEVGRYEEESDLSIDLFRAKAMLALPADSNPAGSKIGDLLFCYSISDAKALSASLDAMSDDQSLLASCLLAGDIEAFRNAIDLTAYKTLPKFYMQALVIAGDAQAKSLFPQQYADEQATYDSFQEALQQVDSESQQFRANHTYIKFHESYFWFYTFKK